MNSNIKDFLKSRNIKAVAFDLDNTLFATREYFTEVLTAVGKEITSYLESDKESDIVAKEFTDLIFTNFMRKNSKPQLIQILCEEGLDEYLGEEKKHLKGNIIGNHLDGFYDIVPPLYEKSIDVLRNILNSEIDIVFHSHASLDWTRLKINEINEKLGGLDLPFLSTDITEEKNSKSWLKAFSLVKKHSKNIMVVGDGVPYDLVPALEIGCMSVTWLNSKDLSVPEILYEYKDKGRNIYMIKDIGELMDISDKNLI